MAVITLHKLRAALMPSLLMLLTLFACTACRSSNTNAPGASSQGLVIVNAPATGEVRRVLASEGTTIGEGAVIAEIAVRQETPNTSATTQNNDPQRGTRSAAQAMQTQIIAARAAAERASIEVERVTALVASGAAPQPQLDAAQAEYQRAQEQLQRAQQGSSNGTAAPAAASQANNASGASGAQVATTATREQIIAARASAAGTVSVIAVRAGQQVTAGQPLATLRTK